ncbi:exodeoxyribonuclease VII small subunit [Candidatus Gromoviella agglomerans]|uniref:exodeoxyribonuclease VII small subunit n=1 Tax=Candidatus Gromoviella agglomerans TaxID=2806609 RepID=UPI001E55C577|nr:exodeoxyribonuclease VII small subunit [Candidatus Gromoviella agglomerans]UFX98583.1 Exodeoxyribonuclease 7 small subunit [Candidatus Gromoviella agglomerans]
MYLDEKDFFDENENDNIKQEQSFEEALSDLEKIIEILDKGDLPLRDAINAYKRGLELKQICNEKLNEAKELMEKIFEIYNKD